MQGVCHILNSLISYFSGKYMWRRRPGETKFSKPMMINSFWREIKGGVDAVYEDLDTGLIWFFKGYTLN